MPRVLLINPPIHDFAAYDFWARPLGLLIAGSLLAQSGFQLDFLDFTDPYSPWLPTSLRPKRKADGQGKFARTFLARPKPLPYIGRRYSRYGLPPEAASAALRSFQPPDAVLMTSMMTYWYPGVQEAIALCKEQWPQTPVVLGGVYATLCAEHARRFSGADWVLPGPVEQATTELGEILQQPIEKSDGDDLLPAHDLLTNKTATALLTSRGCPYSCRYCGVKTLFAEYSPYRPDRVEREVKRIVRDLGIKNIAVYDDALLADKKRAVDILLRIAALDEDVRLHAASGLSVRGIDDEVARAMKRAGFATIRLGLETVDPASQRELGNKATLDEFHQAVEALPVAGFSKESIGVYVMAGMPGQGRKEVEQTVDEILRLGLQPHLSEYSPVPGSPMFAEAEAASAFDLSEPLFHNPTLLSCARGDLLQPAMDEIKRAIVARRRDST